LEDADMAETIQHAPELMLWILFMSNVAASKTEPLNIWFKNSFAEVLSVRKLHHFEIVRRVLIESLWLEGLLNQQLQAIWAEVVTRIKS
jgi:hypothetical protein